LSKDLKRAKTDRTSRRTDLETILLKTTGNKSSSVRIKKSNKSFETETLPDSASEDELVPPAASAKKRKVVMEEVTVAKKPGKSTYSQMSTQTEKSGPVFKITGERYNIARSRGPSEDSYRTISMSRQESENEEDAPKLSRLSCLAKKYKFTNAKIDLSDSDTFDSDTDRPSSRVHPKVQFIFPEKASFVRVIRPTTNDERESKTRKQPGKGIRLGMNDRTKAVMDKEIRATLEEGRKTLDRSRMHMGLDYLGTFRTDYQDEARPGSLVSDQREAKILTRIGSKPEVKSEEYAVKGSLTVLNATGERITTLLTESDRTVFRLGTPHVT